MRKLMTCLTVGWLLVATGCSTLDLNSKAWPWTKDKEEKEKK